MRFEKWYLDAVAADGSGMIGYVARASWGPLAVRCSETLRWPAGEGAVEDRLVLGGAGPDTSASGVQWRSPKLGIAGQWQRVRPALAAVVLHEEAAGRIEWSCGCPAAGVTVDAAGGRWEGLGYAEHLVLTLPPGRLPLRELQWGRFIAEGQSCVWIRWLGPLARAWCFYQGEAAPAEFDDGPGLRWPGHRLELTPGKTLRHGRVADTVFTRAPALRRILPAALGQIRETKWCSRGVLTDAAGRRHEGWAIHEVAIFP